MVDDTSLCVVCMSALFSLRAADVSTMVGTLERVKQLRYRDSNSSQALRAGFGIVDHGVIRGHDEESVKKLQKLKKKVDPEGVFTRMAKGGFERTR
ncbi:hypothetical protein F4814DRAFT_449016 [Daldinia grandis]|nr:hypothetical protein F4814DRAFT_449016 [Daldinia grandis]